MRSLLLASLGIAGILGSGCNNAAEPESSTVSSTPPVASGAGKKGPDLGSSDATPLMSKEDAEKRVGSALGK
jgi:hypothetical protein